MSSAKAWLLTICLLFISNENIVEVNIINMSVDLRIEYVSCTSYFEDSGYFEFSYFSNEYVNLLSTTPTINDSVLAASWTSQVVIHYHKSKCFCANNIHLKKKKKKKKMQIISKWISAT